MNSPPPEAGHERKTLNEVIEITFIECIGDMGAIHAHYISGKGVIGDLYEKFCYDFFILFELTSYLVVMDASTEVTTPVKTWLDLPPVKKLGSEIDDRCKEGLRLFRLYKIALGKNGILTLPSG
jgi:hypothetical protein